MTHDDAKELGLRALAAGFKWAPGCRDGQGGVRLFGPADGLRYSEWVGAHEQYTGAFDGWYGNWPDFRDPATLGVLLAQVRIVYGDAGAHPCPDLGSRVQANRWWMMSGDDTHLCCSLDAKQRREEGRRCCVGGPCHHVTTGPTEAHALVAALEGRW